MQNACYEPVGFMYSSWIPITMAMTSGISVTCAINTHMQGIKWYHVGHG